VDLLRPGRELLQHRRYLEAAQQFRTVAQTAIAAGDERLAARAIGNVGHCQFALRQFRLALDSFLEARRRSELARDSSTAAALDINIASLYAELGQMTPATEWLEGSSKELSGPDRRLYLPALQVELAFLRGREGRMPEALELFREGIDGADRNGDLNLMAQAWTRVGDVLLLGNDLAGAERAQLEAFRIRKLNRLPLDASYCSMGRLRLKQGNLDSAASLLTRAIELKPEWYAYHMLGLVRLRQGRNGDALADLRAAFHLARVWRWQAPGADSARIGAENLLDQVYTAFIEAGNRVYEQTRDAALVRETFEASEENRANSLRSLLADSKASPMPAQYWETAARLEEAEVRALAGGGGTAQDSAALRAELVRIEAAAAPAVEARTENLFVRLQSRLGADTAWISFTLGDSVSWRWAIDRSGLTIDRLPGSKAIEERAAAANQAIAVGADGANVASARLYQTLFGSLEPRFQHARRWVLALDPALSDVPIAALVERSNLVPTFVVETHNIIVVAGAGVWLDRPSSHEPQDARLFLGIGDPIYNQADERQVQPRADRAPATAFTLFGASKAEAPAALALPRLVGTGAELTASARAWQGDAIVLTGLAATREGLLAQLPRRPAILHFATHFLQAVDSSDGMIALSLDSQGKVQLIGPPEIAHWRVPVDLVVLSGCHSAAGPILRGAGMLGLTRAWILAGARNVIGSHWATLDENGALFSVFYRALREQGRLDPAEALRSAQLQMIRTGDWRARPRYWGAYFVVGNP
jgi:CHAT domain-containing protein/tetratricopeptide (TPR) repeat protein